ncbi:MAG: glycosyltransferase family 1 protein, partial [Cellulosimicrobium funkei]
MSRPRLLILSFSPIASDARVLKQVHAFQDDYQVTTCGYGPAPGGVEHLRIPDDVRADDTKFRLLAARLYRAAYSSTG